MSLPFTIRRVTAQQLSPSTGVSISVAAEAYIEKANELVHSLKQAAGEAELLSDLQDPADFTQRSQQRRGAGYQIESSYWAARDFLTAAQTLLDQLKLMRPR